MKKILSLLSAAAVFSALSAAPKASRTVLSEQKAVILENNVLKLTAVPGTMGGLFGGAAQVSRKEHEKKKKIAKLAKKERAKQRKRKK